MKYVIFVLCLLFSSTVFAQNNVVLSSWKPTVHVGGGSNYWESLFTYQAGLSNRTGTVADQWLTSDYVFGTFIETDSSLANSHLIGFNCIIVMPSTLGDGGGGAFSGGFPTNANYQETGCFDGTLIGTSPGMGQEGIGMVVQDNPGGGATTGVPLPMHGILGVINKNAADNTYYSASFQAISGGTQQSTYSPNAAFQISGGFQNGIDFSGFTNAYGALISFPHNSSLTYDSSGNIYFSVGYQPSMEITSAGVSTPQMVLNGQVVSKAPANSCGTGYACLMVPN